MAKKNIQKKSQKKVPQTKKVVSKKLVKPVTVASSDNGMIRPLGNRVLIRPFLKQELEPKNSFGLILPGSDKKEKAEQGTVLALGPGLIQDGKLLPMHVKVGDIVAFSKYGYDDIMVDGEELYLIKEENVLAVLKK